MKTVRDLYVEQQAAPSLEETMEVDRRLDAWVREGGFRRYLAIRACVRAGQKAVPTEVPWEKGSSFAKAHDAIDFACASQILFGEYDDAKVAGPAFVAAVLAEARRQPDLADAPCWRRKR